jgi:UDP-N-acetylmuramyl pentapeptide phosphotransferase/UDP-N-acetylglucosamine-1-phosphate transferase
MCVILTQMFYAIKGTQVRRGHGIRPTTAHEAILVDMSRMPVVCALTAPLIFLSTVQLVEFTSACLSICFMLFLGFMDDVLDLPWRAKLVIPPVATLPLLCSYTGLTSVVLPIPVGAGRCIPVGVCQQPRRMLPPTPRRFLPSVSSATV